MPERDYQLIDAVTVKVAGKTRHLVKLKNNHTEKEWSSTFSRECPKWSPAQQDKYYGQLQRGQFFMELVDYVKYFNHTSIMVDARQRAHYPISSAGVNMKDKKDYFF